MPGLFYEAREGLALFENFGAVFRNMVAVGFGDALPVPAGFLSLYRPET